MKSKEPGGLPEVDPKFKPDIPKVKSPYRPFTFPPSEFRDPNEGWICPRCGTCWNPDMAHCTCVATEEFPSIKDSELNQLKHNERIEK